jgi:hypothetical protein
VAQGLFDIAKGAASISRVSKSILEKRKSDTNSNWVASNLLQYDRVLTDFYSLEENRQREDFHEALEGSANKELARYLKEAPSKEAADEFRLKAGQRFAFYYRNAISVSEANRIENLQLGIDGQMSDLLASWRNNAKSLPPAEARELMAQGFDEVMGNMESVFGELPKYSRIMREKLTKDYILAVSDHDQAFAKQMLDDSDFFSESDRQAIQRHIDSKADNNRAVAKTVLTQGINSAFTVAESKLEPVPDISLESFQAAYATEDSAMAAKMAFDQKRRVANKAIGFLSNMAEKNITTQERAYQSMRQRAETQGDSDTLEALASIRPSLNEIQRMQSEDPVGFLNSHNESVKDLNQRISTADPEEAEGLLAVRRQLAFQLQGSPPQDTPEHMRDQFLNRPQSDWNLLSQSEASDWGKKFNEMRDLTQAPILVNEFIETYGRGTDPQDAARMARIAFNDLVSLPDSGERLDPAYQVGFMMWDSPYVGHFWGALQAKRASQGSTEDSVRDYRDSIRGTEEWVGFSRFLSTSPEGTVDGADFMEGLTAFAMYLDPSNAGKGAEKAMEIVFKDRFGFVNVNGQQLMIDKRAGDRRRDDAELHGIGLGLESLLRTVRKEDLKMEDPLWAGVLPQPFSQASPEGKDILFRSAITNHAFFRMTPDGRGANLYLIGEHGIPFEARKADGNPFLVLFDRYEEIVSSPSRTVMSPEGFSVNIEAPNRPSRAYHWE